MYCWNRTHCNVLEKYEMSQIKAGGEKRWK